MADALGNGPIVAKEAKKLARFDKAASSTQCYRYQNYGHMASPCRNETLCAECSHAHDTRAYEIIASAAPWACAVCHQEGHAAYDSDSQMESQREETNAQETRHQDPVLRLLLVGGKSKGYEGGEKQRWKQLLLEEANWID